MTVSDYEGQDGQENQHEDAEAEARKLGWAPRDKWRGRPEDFVEADEFVKRGREVLPLVRSQFEKARAENEDLKRQIEDRTRDFEDRIKRSERMAQKSLEMQRAQLVADFETQKRQAVINGDTEAFDRVSRQEQDTYRRFAEDNKAEAQASQKPGQPDVPPEVQEWGKRNPWFFSDHALSLEAQGLHAQFRQESPGMPLSENLDRVTETLKQRYPQKFGVGQTGDAKPPQRGYSAVEGGSSMRGAPASRAKGWKELPAEARQACESMISRGYLKGDAQKIKDNYAKTYWEEDGE